MTRTVFFKFIAKRDDATIKQTNFIAFYMPNRLLALIERAQEAVKYIAFSDTATTGGGRADQRAAQFSEQRARHDRAA